MPATTYYNRSRGAVAVACGDIVAPGGTTSRVNPRDPHDRTLIDADVIVAVEPAKTTAKKGDQ